MRILEFKEFKNLLLEDELTDAAAASGVGDTAAASGVGDTAAASNTVVPPPPPNMEAGLPPDPNAQPVTPAATTSQKFIFIQDAKNKKWFGSHDDQGGVKRFTQYQIDPTDLTKWLEVHGMESHKDLVMVALTGTRDLPDHIYKELKKEVTNGMLGVDKGTVDVTFSSDTDFKKYTVDNLAVGCVKSSS